MKLFVISLCFAIFIAVPPSCEADFGGHDLFTSLAQLQVLWQNDQEVVKDMENIILKLDKAKKSLEQ